MSWLGLTGLLALGVLGTFACGDPNDPEPTIGSLSGTVRDADTDAAIEGVTLVVAGIQGQTGSDGRYQIDSGGTPPYQWMASHPPPGLGVTGDGLVSGTPGFPAGAYTLGVSVRDAESALVSAVLTLEIQTTSGFRAVGEQLSTGEAGMPYADTLRAEGGAPPYTFELDGLPAGLQLDPATGVVSGTPQGGTGPDGEPIELELIVRDVVGASAFAPASIGILPGPLVISSDLPDGQVGVTYEAFFEHTGGFGTFDTYTVISGNLPPGLSISGPQSLFGSRLHGTPILVGTYQFTVQLSLCVDPLECTPQLATKEYLVVIAGSPLSIVTSSLPDADVGTPYSVFLVREGGSGPFQWDLVSGSLRAGISLTAAGELTGRRLEMLHSKFASRTRAARALQSTSRCTWSREHANDLAKAVTAE